MRSYHSLEAWKVAHQAVILTYRTCDRFYHPRVRSLIDQLRRVALSIEANIVEGYALGTTTLFRRHARISLGSAAEAQCLIRNMSELAYVPPDAASELEKLFGRAIGLLRGLVRRPLAIPAHRVPRTAHHG